MPSIVIWHLLSEARFPKQAFASESPAFQLLLQWRLHGHPQILAEILVRTGPQEGWHVFRGCRYVFLWQCVLATCHVSQFKWAIAPWFRATREPPTNKTASPARLLPRHSEEGRLRQGPHRRRSRGLSRGASLFGGPLTTLGQLENAWGEATPAIRCFTHTRKEEMNACKGLCLEASPLRKGGRGCRVPGFQGDASHLRAWGCKPHQSGTGANSKVRRQQKTAMPPV